MIPVADPNIYSLSQRVTLASENLKIAMSNPNMHNLREAYRRVYAALGTRDIDKVLKPEPPIVPKDPAIENMEALQMKLPKAFPQQDHQAHIASHTTFMAYQNGSSESNGVCFTSRTRFRTRKSCWLKEK